MRTAAQLIAMAGMLAVAAACSRGRVMPSASGMSIVATSPSGQIRSGELLATPDSGIVFLADRARVVFTSFSNGIALTNETSRSPSPRVRITGRPDAADLHTLRFHSRYPLGIDDDTLIRFMSALDQRQPEVWP